MRVFLDFNPVWPSILNGIAEPWRQTNAGIAGPRENHFCRAARADHLVVDEIGCEADKCQIPQLLADDFVSRRKWNQMAETFGGHGIAAVHQVSNRLFQSEK